MAGVAVGLRQLGVGGGKAAWLGAVFGGPLLLFMRWADARHAAGVAGTMQIYTLPGSVRAVEEYMAGLLKTLEHVLYMVHGLDVH